MQLSSYCAEKLEYSNSQFFSKPTFYCNFHLVGKILFFFFITRIDNEIAFGTVILQYQCWRKKTFYEFKLDRNGSLTASQIKGIRAVPLLTLVSKIQPIRFIHNSLKRLNCHFKHAETKIRIHQ